MNKKLQCVIGLEIHAAINSKSKIFSNSAVCWNSPSNTNINDLDLALPGALPVINQVCIIKSIQAALGLKCTINNYSEFDRKNYFYPDSPLGYQISQFYHPIAEHGEITLSNDKKIRINRLHIEADAGKSIHEKTQTLIDLNRAGTGLMEIVTEPDIKSASEAVETMSYIIQILQYTNSSKATLEQGTIRCDVNISLHEPGTPLGTRVEIKNLNSLTSIEDAIEYEIQRQTKAIENNEKILQETRLWDVNNNKTQTMRSKETAEDYRYFPDPNLLPVYVSDNEIQTLKKSLPKLHYERELIYTTHYQIANDNAKFLCSKKEISDYFDKTIQIYHELYLKNSNNEDNNVKTSKPHTNNAESTDSSKSISSILPQKNSLELNNNQDNNQDNTQNHNEQKFIQTQPKKIANWIISILFGLLNKEQKYIQDSKLTPKQLAEIIFYNETSQISSSSGKKILTIIHNEDGNVKEIIDKLNLWQISDTSTINNWIDNVLNTQKELVQRFLSGKTNVKKSLIGMVIKKSAGKANPIIVTELMDKKLNLIT